MGSLIEDDVIVKIEPPPLALMEGKVIRESDDEVVAEATASFMTRA